MTYQGNLNNNQKILIKNALPQTQITLTSIHGSSQQSQSSGFVTGEWVTPPILYRTSGGYILRIEASLGQKFLQIQANSINILSNPPSLNNAEVLQLQQVSDPSTPMEPMKPMKMGNMSMSSNPMEMRMGDMSMKMGENPSSESVKGFCTQCGHEIKSSDRFCGYCGHQL